MLFLSFAKRFAASWVLSAFVLGCSVAGMYAVAAPFAYIPNSGSNSVTVIDTATNTVFATVPVGIFPTAVAVNLGGARAYVANQNSGDVSVIDTATNSVVTSVAVGTLQAVAIDPAGNRVYTANGSSDSVSVIDTASNSVVATVAVGTYASSVAVNPAGTFLYVTNENSNNVSVIDTASNTVTATVAVGSRPYGVAISPDGSRAYVTNSSSSSVSVIDTASNTVVATVNLGLSPFGVAVNPAGTRVYLTTLSGGAVPVIDTATNSVVATAAAGASPYGVAVNPAGTFTYVANNASWDVSVIDTTSNAVVASIAVGIRPRAFGRFIGGPLTNPPPPPIVVFNTLDGLPGSLRDAINIANACTGQGNIVFDIPGAGPHLIQPLTPLPPITCGGASIDGYTQSGIAFNTDTTGGNNATIKIDIDGSGLRAVPIYATADGLQITGFNVTVRGLAIRSFGGAGINVTNSGVSIHGNYIGTDAGGMGAFGNTGAGILNTGNNLQVGQTSAADANVISNNRYGVLFQSAGSGQISGNLIGGKRDGSLGNGNADEGVYFQGVTGQASTVRANTIRYNGGAGIGTGLSSSGQIFIGNESYNNTGIGIDLNDDGPTPNGTIGVQDFPVISSVVHSGGNTIITGTIQTTGIIQSVQLYDNSVMDSKTEGKKLIDTFDATQITAGSFTRTISGFLADNVTATAVSSSCSGSCSYRSSEYSPKVAASLPPLSCYTLGFVPSMGDAGNGGTQSYTLLAPAGASVQLKGFCNPSTGVAFAWSTAETTDTINVTAPAPGVSTTYTLTGTSTAGTGTATVIVRGADSGTPVCALTPSVFIPVPAGFTSTFTVSASCSPAATTFTWSNDSTLQLAAGQGTSTATYQLVSSTPGFGYPMYLTPTNAIGTGPDATLVVYVDPLTISPASIVFPNTTVGSQSAPQSIVVSNVSPTYNGAVSNVVATGPFLTTGCIGPSGPGTSCTINVTFAPTIAGAGQTGSIEIDYYSNSPQVRTVALLGNPIAALPSAPTIGAAVPGNAQATVSFSAPASDGGSAITSYTVTSNPGGLTATGTSSPITVTGLTNGTSYTFTVTATNAVGTGPLSAASNAVTPSALALTLTPSSLAFATRTVSTTSPAQTVTVTNTGPAVVTISSITVSGDFAFTSLCGSSLAAGATCTIDVTFTPLTTGPRTGAVTITSNATGSPHTLALSGSGQVLSASIIQVTPTVGEFAPQEVGTMSAPDLFVITNVGNAPLVFADFSVTGAGFTLLPTITGTTYTRCGASIVSGAVCAVQVTFSPTGLGPASGVLHIAGNATNSPVDANLVASGVITVPPRALTVPASVGFGNQAVGTQSTGHVVTIANNSASTVSITGLTTDGDFSVSDTCTTIAPHASCAPLVFFRPTAVGDRAGHLTIRTLSESEPYVVALNGTGTFNPVPQITLSVTQLGFGNTLLGVPTSAQVVIRNVGQVPVAIESIVATGDFFVSQTCGASIAVGGTCPLIVSFYPRMTGGTSGGVEIRTNVTGSPHQVQLSGVGCAIPSVARARFGGLVCGP